MRTMAMLLMLLATLATPAFATDGVLEIDQACAMQTGCFAGDTAGFPVTIAASGSYRLTSNLVVASTTANGITMSVNNVAVDLNGFSVTGPGSGTGIGIQGFGTRFGYTVRNGFVRAMGGTGIELGRESQVRDVTTAEDRKSVV